MWMFEFYLPKFKYRDISLEPHKVFGLFVKTWNLELGTWRPRLLTSRPDFWSQDYDQALQKRTQDQDLEDTQTRAHWDNFSIIICKRFKEMLKTISLSY